jgi:hypothetical protein
MACSDGGPCGSAQAIAKYYDNVYANEAAAAESQSIGMCGWHGGCVMQQLRNYQNPDYARQQALYHMAQEEQQAAEEQAMAAREAAARAAQAHSGGFWGEVAGVLDQASSIMNTVALVTCWIPGVDEVTAAAAISLDVADGLVNAGIAFSQGDISGGVNDLASAGLAAATGGIGGGAAAEAETGVARMVSAGGRRGSAAVRGQLDDVRDELLTANPDWSHVAGGRVAGTGAKLPERAVVNPANPAQRRFPDLTFNLPDGSPFYVNTVDTYASGAPTIREFEAAVDINLWGGGPVLMIPKP